MAETVSAKSFYKVTFLGSSFEVDPSINRREITIPTHTILDEFGADTGLQCPSTIGILSTSHMMTGEIEVVTYCNSANKPFPAVGEGGWAQCRHIQKTLLPSST